MAATIPPTVLLTRPQAASERFAALIKAPCVISPLMETVWLAPETSPDADALVFTSETGVLGWMRLNEAKGIAFCVGDRTAAVAQQAGFDARSAQGDAQDLARMLDDLPDQTRLLHVRGRHVASDMGGQATPYIVYEQQPRDLTKAARDLLGGDGQVVVPFFSPRSVTLFAAQNSPLRAMLIPVAISPTVAEAIGDAKLPDAIVAERPDAEAMLRAVQSVLG